MSLPRFSVGEYTTRSLSFQQDLEVYRTAGVDGIGIDFGLKLPVEDAEELAQFRASGLTATFCFGRTPSVLPLPQIPGSSEPQQRIDKMCAGLEQLARYDPVACVCVTGPQGDLGRRQAFDIVVGGLRDVAQAAAGFGIQIGLEPMHTSLVDEWSLVSNLTDSMRLMEAVDEPNMGVMFDIWHLCDTPELLADTKRFAQSIVGVQVNDRRSPTRSWCDRVLPGDGVADIRGILAALDAGGYDGFFELEIFSDDGTFRESFPDSLWARDPLEVVVEGKNKFEAIWEARHDQRDASRGVV